MAAKDKADIWMPLYIGDYLADTMHLTTEQHGAYLLLIMAYWKNGGPLPGTAQRMAAVTRLSVDAWSMHKHELASFFDVREADTQNELWIHPRAEREMNSAANNKEKQTLRAKKAADARWGKNAPSNAQGHAQAMLGDMLEECPSPSPSSNKDLDQKNTAPPKTKAPKKPAVAKPKTTLTADDLEGMGVNRQHAVDWLAVRAKKRAPLTVTAWELMVSESKLANITVARAVQIAAQRGWQSLKAEWLERDNGFSGQTNTGTIRESRPSLVEKVRQRGRELELERSGQARHGSAPAADVPPAWVTEGSGVDWDGEFERVDVTDGSIVGTDD